MNDRHRPAAPDAGETPTPADPSTSPQHHMSRRPVLLAALVGAGSLAGCSLIHGSSSAGSSGVAERNLNRITLGTLLIWLVCIIGYALLAKFGS